MNFCESFMSEQPSVFGSNTHSQVLRPTCTHTHILSADDPAGSRVDRKQTNGQVFSSVIQSRSAANITASESRIGALFKLDGGKKNKIPSAFSHILLDSHMLANRERIRTGSTHLYSLKHFSLYLCDISSGVGAAYASGSQNGGCQCAVLTKFHRETHCGSKRRE